MAVIFNGPPKVTPEEFVTVKFNIVFPAKVLDGIIWAAIPFISIVPDEAVNVPLFEIDSAIWRIFPITVNEELPFITRFLQAPVAPELKIGLLVTFGISTFFVKSGRKGQDQFPIVFQSVLIAPVQVRSAITVKAPDTAVVTSDPHPPCTMQ